MDAPEKAAVTPLGVNGLKIAESVRNLYQITAPAGAKPGDLTDPAFWVHVARLMRMGDKIEVLASDASWYAELRVMEVGKTGSFGARLAFTLPPVELKNDSQLPALNDYEARPYGSVWHVYKNGTDDPVKVDLPSQEAALKWITSHRRAMAA